MNSVRTITFAAAIGIACLFGWDALFPAQSLAQDGTGSVAAAPEGTPPAEESGPPSGLLGILMASGPVGLLILLLSIAGVSLVIEHAMTIRQSVLMPPGLSQQVRDSLAAGQLRPAVDACKSRQSLLSFVLLAGLSEVESGWREVEKAVEEALAEQAARLFRKIEYLSLIGNIAPMMGLLGTVIGMIFAFRQVAETQGAANAGDLAQGIYLALVTTVEGLIVAIPSVAAFAIFRNRVDQLMAEATFQAQHALVPLKRRAAAPPTIQRTKGS